jgi:hypothetical protein
VIRDVEFAASLLGYDTNDDFASTRVWLVHEAGHSYTRRRAVVDSVPDDVLRASQSEVRTVAVQWRASALAAADREAVR